MSTHHPDCTPSPRRRIVQAEPGRYRFPGGAWEPDAPPIGNVCEAKSTIHYVKEVFPGISPLKRNSALRLFYQFLEFLEQVPGIVGAGRGLRMILY